MIQFPSNFLWGAATSAYQVEGNNTNSDWWLWEKQAGKEPSGEACRHYERYEQDFDLAKSLHHNAHRFSVEWARIEPEEGKFSQKELQHYIDVLKALRARNIEPIVTLHHFTNPVWLARLAGWENRKTVSYFLRYTDFVVEALAPYVRYWITINEPTIFLSHAYFLGLWPPQQKSILKAKRVEDHLALAHMDAYRRMHRIYSELKLTRPMISISQHLQAFLVCAPGLKNKLAAYLRHKWFNLGLLDRFARSKTLDFIGINYYSRQVVELEKWGIRNLTMDTCKNNHHPVNKNSLGWDIYPEGLAELLVKLKTYRLPLMITENGICTTDDNIRWSYIQDHLKSVHRAMEKGAPVIGYLHWSLLDNFEWDKGFGPRFGLIDVNYKTYERTVRPSAVKYGEICRTGRLD